MDINPNYTMIIQFANLLILLILLNIFLFQPVLTVINRREGTINSLSDRVQKAKEAIDQFKKEYEEKSRERKKPIIESRDLIIAETHTISMYIIEKARIELSEELTRIKGEIQGESKRVLERLNHDVDRLSSEVIMKILQRSL